MIFSPKLLLIASLTSWNVLTLERFPNLIRGSCRLFSINAICFAKVLSKKTSLLRGPEWVPILVTNVLILCGVAALLIFTQSCGTVSGFGQDIKDVSDWSKDKLQNSDEEEVKDNGFEVKDIE